MNLYLPGWYLGQPYIIFENNASQDPRYSPRIICPETPMICHKSLCALEFNRSFIIESFLKFTGLSVIRQLVKPGLPTSR